MDSLSTLMERKSYDLVIKLTENSNDPVALFYRITSFLAVGQSQEALNVINSKQLILQQRLAILIKIHIEILCLLGRFDEAYDKLHYYEELPYESQEVEEQLQAMKQFIRDEEKSQNKRDSLNEDEIMNKLMGTNDAEVLAALDALKNFKIDRFLLPILKIMRSYPKQVVRTFALLLLVDAKYDKEVQFLYFDELITVIPSSLEEPFIIPGLKDLNELAYSFQSLYHDPSVSANALHIVSSYLLYIYPHKIDMSLDEILIVFGFLAKKLLQANIDDLEAMCQEKGLDYQATNRKINEINEDLKNF